MHGLRNEVDPHSPRPENGRLGDLFLFAYLEFHVEINNMELQIFLCFLCIIHVFAGLNLSMQCYPTCDEENAHNL